MQKKQTLSLVLLCLLLIFLAGCQSAAPKTPTPAPEQKSPPPAPVTTVSVADYFPTSPGSSWTFKGTGNEFASFKRDALFTLNNLAQFKEDNGGTISTSIYRVSGDAITRIYFQAEKDQAGNLLPTGYTSNDNTIFLKAPLEIGTTWQDKDEVKKITDTSSRVETPAGVFNECIKVEIRSKNSTSVVYEYYHKGIGLVEREFNDGSNIISSSLEKYQIGH